MIFYHCFFLHIWFWQMFEGNYIMKFILIFGGLNWFLPMLVFLHEKIKFYANLIEMKVRKRNLRKTRASRSFAPRISICCFVSTVRLLCTQFARKNVLLLRTLMLSFVWNYKINRKRLTIDSKPIKSANIFFIEF